MRSSQGEALGDWLRANGYDVPPSMQPTIDAFTTEGFDFIALRLAPGEGIQAMQPVRVITAGADPSLPLRMVAAGVGANVGIELFVLSEGRYHPQNFPDVTIDFTQLAWDPSQSRSNYTELAAAALASNGGNGWLTEGSQPANLFGAGGLNPPLSTTYDSTCSELLLPAPASCSEPSEAGVEAGTDASDAGTADDAAEAGAAEGGAGDAGTPDAGSCQPTVVPCDDLNLAMTGIDMGSLWITRLRANLPSAALATDLVLEAAPSQTEVPNVHSTQKYTDPSYNPCPKNGATGGNGSSSSGCACRAADSRRNRYAEAILAILGLVAMAGAIRRRSRTS